MPATEIAGRIAQSAATLRRVLALAAALLLAVAPGHPATVRVPVANVWEAPDAGHLPLDPHVWPTPEVTLLAAARARRPHADPGAVRRARARAGEAGGWTNIAVPDQPSPLDRRGYPGWVRSWQLGPAFAARARGDGAEREARKRDRGRLRLKVPRARCRPRRRGALPRTRPIIVRTAKQFLGLHYLWGGLSAWGYDCSGLTWAVYRTHGITIPRDADAQFAAGTPVRSHACGPATFSSTSTRCRPRGDVHRRRPDDRGAELA